MGKVETKIVVGGILERNGKYLLVQEAQAKCHGKWNIPAGGLDAGETLIEGMKREVREESGFKVEPTGICQIGNHRCPHMIFASVIFTVRIISGEIKFDPDEILDAKWFSYEEIIVMQDQLRSKELILGVIENIKNRVIAPLEILSNYS